MQRRNDIQRLSAVYAAALADKGAVPAGVLWPNAPDLAARFEVLLGAIDFERRHYRHKPLRLLDLGCGPGLLLDYLAANKLLDQIEYTGVDVFEATICLAQSRWPQFRFELRDVRDHPFDENVFDYCLACGAFTGKFNVSYQEMDTMVRDTLSAVWPSLSFGLSFNVMSKHVDWERADLFHWPLDKIMSFCKERLSRHVSLHLDYGLWEASVIVLKQPAPRRAIIPCHWHPGKG